MANTLRSIIDQTVKGGLTIPVAEATTPQLVRAYAEINVRFSVHAALTPDKAGWFGPLGPITNELIKRGVLD